MTTCLGKSCSFKVRFMQATLSWDSSYWFDSQSSLSAKFISLIWSLRLIWISFHHPLFGFSFEWAMSCQNLFVMYKWATWQNQQNECGPSEDSDQPGHHPVWSESLLCAQWVAKDPRFLHADSEDWSDWEDAQANLSLRWAHTHSVGFVMSRLK